MLATMAKSLAKQVDKASAARGRGGDHRSSLGTTHLTISRIRLRHRVVVEDLEVKRSVFRELNAVVHADAIIATNTSTLSVIELAMETSRRSGFAAALLQSRAGDVARRVVRPICASDETMDRVTSSYSRAQRTGQREDQAGFVVNALLFPYLNNAIRLLEQGVATKEGIDIAMKAAVDSRWTFAVGPRGTRHVARNPRRAVRRVRRTELLAATAPSTHGLGGQLGRKSGSGFYDYRR